MNKKKLQELERSGKHLFHGSARRIDVLEPKQAYTLNKESNKKEKDGVPAVFATPYLGIAIFRAIVNSNNAPYNHLSGFSYESSISQISFSVSKETYNQAKDKSGYVHVFNKIDFQPKKPGKEECMDWISEVSVSPIFIKDVYRADLPESIRFI